MTADDKAFLQDVARVLVNVKCPVSATHLLDYIARTEALDAVHSWPKPAVAVGPIRDLPN